MHKSLTKYAVYKALAVVGALYLPTAAAGEIAIGYSGSISWLELAQPEVETFDEDVKILIDIKPNVGPFNAMIANYHGASSNLAAVRYADIKPNVGPFQYASLNLGEYGMVTGVDPITDIVAMSRFGSAN